METPSPFPCLISAIRLGLTIKQKGNGFSVSLFSYANTKILIVTCYLLLQGLGRCCAFAMPSLCLRSSSLFWDGIWNGLGTDLKRRRSGLGTVSQRNHNGLTTDSRRNCIGGITRAFSRIFIVFQAYRKPQINA